MIARRSRRQLPAFLLLALLGGSASAGEALRTLNVLFVGNSLVYANNLPALFASLANAQGDGTHYAADLIAAPGGRLAERWDDGVVAREIAGGRWHLLLLQEQGGLLACLADSERRGQADCSASLAAHRKLARLAQEHGVRVIVLGTWGPDAIWQRQLGRGLRMAAASAGAQALDAGPPVRAFASAHPGSEMFVDRLLHPSLATSLLVAGLLYRAVAGTPAQPRTLDVGAPLLPALADVRPDRLASAQAQLAGDGQHTTITAGQLEPLLTAAAR